MEPDGKDDLGKGDKPTGASPQANWGVAFDLGIRLGISVILGLGAGLLLDSWLHTSPIFTLVGMVLGIGAAMYTIWDVAKQSMGR